MIEKSNKMKELDLIQSNQMNKNNIIQKMNKLNNFLQLNSTKIES